MAGEIDNFKTFLIAEYENIADAHFKAIDSISDFFKHYVLIMSIPLAVIAMVSQKVLEIDKKAQIKELLHKYNLLPAIVFYSITLVGLGLFCYIINIRLDAILYARTVNGIRKHFFDNFNQNICIKTKSRVLPQSPHVPHYYETSLFIPVVLVFSLINGLYFSIGSCFLKIGQFLKKSELEITERNFSDLIGRFFDIVMKHQGIVLSSIVFFLFHFLLYYFFSRHREFGYLKSNIIGIDIDGVLNQHREHFCTILKKQTEITINPHDITKIPVCEYPNSPITDEEEKQVFNDPQYWTDMPSANNASKALDNFMNSCGFKVLLFSRRPWPRTKDKKVLRDLKAKFRDSIDTSKHREWIGKIIKRLTFFPIKKITKDWLNKNSMTYDKLFIEGAGNHPIFKRLFHTNRFQKAAKKKIKFFIEDDFHNAIKLSFICDVVFLFNHPYNEPEVAISPLEKELRGSLPANIVRVNNWEDISCYVKQLS